MFKLKSFIRFIFFVHFLYLIVAHIASKVICQSKSEKTKQKHFALSISSKLHKIRLY